MLGVLRSALKALAADRAEKKVLLAFAELLVIRLILGREQFVGFCEAAVQVARCVMDTSDPDIRFDKHKAGIQANSFVQDFGLRLLPALYERYNPMTYEDARLMEVDLGIALRKAGYGVWQA